MFDFHMHSTLSFDGRSTPIEILRAAEKAGLREICFTDHRDRLPVDDRGALLFDPLRYERELAALQSDSVKIRLGMEFGMLPNNQDQLCEDLRIRNFDFVLGSVHYTDIYDVYYPPYWEGRTVETAEKNYLEETLACVQSHDGFDVLAHLTYIAKVKANPVRRPVPYEQHKTLIDEILRTLVRKEIGLEMNTSGIDRCGDFLPSPDYFVRFKELGGKIVTVGSDAHHTDRVGQYSARACKVLKDIFGYVCTFEQRKPIFHRDI